MEIERVESEFFAPPIDAALAKPEAQEHTVANLLQVFEGYAQWRGGEIEPIWEAVYRAYKGYRPVQTRVPYTTIYTIREVFRQIETLKPQVVAQFMGEELFRYKPQHAGDEDGVAAATRIVHKQLREYGSDVQLMKWLEGSVLWGTSYLLPEWYSFRRSHLKIQSMHAPEGQPWWKRDTSEVVMEAPYCEYLHPLNVYTHPFVEDVQQSPVVFVRDVVSVADLKTFVRQGWLDAQAVKRTVENEGTPREPAHTVTTYQAAYDRRLDQGPDGETPHEMIRAFCSNGWDYVLLDRQFLGQAQLREALEIPVLAHRNYPQDGEHYGLPEALVILEEQKSLTDLTSMYVDTIKYSHTPMYLVHTNEWQQFMATTFRPGGGIKVQDMSHVTPLPTDLSKGSQLQSDIQFVLQRMKVSTGVTDEFAGVGSAQRTATGVARIQDAAGQRLQHKVRWLMPGMRKLYKMLHTLNAQYLEREIELPMEGGVGLQQFQRWAPDIFQAEIDVEVELANAMESGPEQFAKWSTIYQMMRQDPLINPKVLIETLVRSSGDRHYRRWVADPQYAQTDALRENEQALAYGVVSEPLPSDNDMMHLQIHELALGNTQIAGTNPRWPEALAEHLGLHQQRLQMQQQAQGEAAQMGPPATGLGETEQRTEQMFANGARGAMQQAMPMGGITGG